MLNCIKPYRVLQFALFTATVAFVACTKEKESNVFTGYSYYPANIGHELIYDVDSIVKSDVTGIVDSFQFQIREVVESEFKDNEGRPTLRLERYKRLTPADPWIIYRVWTANVSLKNVERKEENITYIKLVFPPSLNLKWNGNIKNTLGEQIYRVTSVNAPDNINGLNFDSTLTVVQNDFDDCITPKYFFVEKFATGAGMYYKENFYGVYSQQPGQFCKLISFNHYTEKLISYKN